MCSISTRNDKSKKRKQEQLEDQTTDQLHQQEHNPAKKQMTNTSTSVPTTDSLSNLLVQALQSSDDVLINKVINKKDTVVETTIKNLPNAYVEPLFNYLQKSLYEQGENINYVVCLRKLFQFKISQILNIPNIRNNLKMLSDNLDLRCDLLDKCYKLKGRLDLMFLMLNKDETAINEENIVVYESSSEQDDDDDEDEEENIMKLMNSDDEERNAAGENGQEESDAELDDDLMDE